MQLPNNLQHFPHKALLIVGDSVAAKFYLLGGDEMEEIDGVSVPREREQDAEGAFTSYDGSRVGGPSSDIKDEPRLHHFVHELVERTEKLIGTHGVAHLNLVMPAEVEHPFSSHLSKPTAAKIMRRLHKDLMKENPIKIIERLLAG